MNPPTIPADYRPPVFEWDHWQGLALERGLAPDLATLGRAVMREAHQHAWCERLKAECGIFDDGRAMLRRALARPERAAARWHWLLVTDGLRSIPPDTRQGILESCDRALDEARAAVDALGRSPDEPLGLVLHRAARQVAERYGASLEVDPDPTITVGSDPRHALAMADFTGEQSTRPEPARQAGKYLAVGIKPDVTGKQRGLGLVHQVEAVAPEPIENQA